MQIQRFSCLLAVSLLVSSNAACFSSEKAKIQPIPAMSADCAAHLKLAKDLYAQKRDFGCLDECNKVLLEAPNSAEAWLLVGNSWQNVHKPAKALEAYRKFVANSKEPQPQYQTLIGLLEDQVKEQANSLKGDPSADNYLAAVTERGVWRWSHTDPITVFIKPGAGVPGYRPEFEESLRAAFEDWSEATNGKFKFVVQEKENNPDITVNWTDDLHAPALTNEAGDAQLQAGPEGISKATVRLLTVDSTKQGPLGAEALHNICLHELGHALGLQGHSTRETDIMFPVLYAGGLSKRDANTLLALYAVDKKAAEALPAVDAYGRPLSAAQQAERLVTQGSEAAASGDYKRGRELLVKALLLGSKDPLAIGNLCACCNNLAVADGCPSDDALRYVREALYWDKSEKIARSNLDVFLSNAGKDPKSAVVRRNEAESCLKKGDLQGAVVEMRIALQLKDDPALREKLAACEKQIKH